MKKDKSTHTQNIPGYFRLVLLNETMAKWRRRQPADRGLLVEAFFYLGLARMMVLTLPFSRIARFLGRHMDDSSRFVRETELFTALRIGRSVVSMAAHTPWESVCLPQAMAAQWMLMRRKIPGVLFLGVHKDTEKPSGLAAHAWLRCGNAILTGEKGHQDFAVVSTFSTGPRFKHAPFKR